MLNIILLFVVFICLWMISQALSKFEHYKNMNKDLTCCSWAWCRCCTHDIDKTFGKQYLFSVMKVVLYHKLVCLESQQDMLFILLYHYNYCIACGIEDKNFPVFCYSYWIFFLRNYYIFMHRFCALVDKMFVKFELLPTWQRLDSKSL